MSTLESRIADEIARSKQVRREMELLAQLGVKFDEATRISILDQADASRALEFLEQVGRDTGNGWTTEQAVRLNRKLLA